MIQEDKNLLFKDLCARLPYGVMCSIKGHEEKYWDSNFERYITNSIDKPVRITGISIDKDCIELDSLGISEVYGSDDFGGLKPYLRPMSSMTEEECDKVEEILDNGCIFDFMGNGDIVLHKGNFTQKTLSKLYDFYNSIHVDYHTDDEGRTMIEKGLAIEAPDGMYNTAIYDR